jgi:hypothetical protein
MAKTRSPQYPAISLKEAVEKVRLIWDQDYQNALPRPVVAQHMGYQSLNGKSLGVLAALGKYGLLEGRGDNTRVSDLAVTILAHPPGTPERVEALRGAASRPELFAELEGKFPGGKASDQAIRSYLLTQKFIPTAADAAIRAYRDTKGFVDGESRGYTATEPAEEAESPMEPALRQPAARNLPPLPSGSNMPVSENEGDAYRLSISKSRGLEVVARLTTAAELDDLLEALSVWRVLLKPVPRAGEGQMFHAPLRNEFAHH